MSLKNENVVFVERNYNLLRKYVFKLFPHSLEQREYYINILQDWNHSYNTRTLLEDSKKNNQQKYDYFLSKFSRESLIVSVIAGRGQGKTAFSTRLLEDLSLHKKIYALYPFPDKDKIPFVNIVHDLSQVPNNCIVYIDELGQKYPARDSASKDALALTNELITLRHRGISIIASAQDLSLIDINYVRLSDIVVYKYYNISSLDLTRQGFYNELVTLLMPRNGEIEKVLVVDRGEYSTFKFKFSEFSKQASHYFKDVKDEKDEIITYLKQYYKKTQILEQLLTRYNIKLTIDEQKQYNLI